MSERQAKPQFRKEVTPVMNEYREQRRQMMDQTAGRGFIAAPGFLHGAHIRLETATKLKLSEVNYNILAATVDMELKQAGLEYDLQYKYALMNWEVEKQQLYADWEVELAQIKRDMALEEEEVHALAREVARRGILLEESKSAIAIEKEQYRQEIEKLGGETAEHEVALANAKVLTAEKKLEVLPHLERLVEIERDLVEKQWGIVDKNGILLTVNEQILAVERDLQEKIGEVVQKSLAVIGVQREVLEKDRAVLEKDEERAGHERELIDRETEVAEKRRDELGPAIDSLAEVYERYSAEIEIQTEIHSRIAQKKDETADAEQQRLDVLDRVLEMQKELSGVTLKLVDETVALTEYKIERLAPAMARLVAAYERLSREIETQINLKLENMEVRKETALLDMDRVDREIEVSEANLAVEEMRRRLSEVQNERDRENKLLEKTLLKAGISDIRELRAYQDDSAELVNRQERSTERKEQDHREAMHRDTLARQLESHSRVKNQERATTDYIAGQDALRTKERAQIAAAPKITANLKHLLSL